jgi:hypothetical protein
MGDGGSGSRDGRCEVCNVTEHSHRVANDDLSRVRSTDLIVLILVTGDGASSRRLVAVPRRSRAINSAQSGRVEEGEA